MVLLMETDEWKRKSLQNKRGWEPDNSYKWICREGDVRR